MRNIVLLLKKAAKSLERAPVQVQQKAAFWKKLVEMQGIGKAKQLKGFHDEPLKGDRFGQRSIRLNIQWRAIYTTKTGLDGEELVEIIEVIEVTPHKY